MGSHKGIPKGKPLSPEQCQYIKDHILIFNMAELSRQMGKSVSAIQRFIRRANIKIPDELLEARKRSGQLKKGHKTHNKGKKREDYLSQDAIERCKTTQFKKGHFLPSSKFEWIDTDGHTHIKIGENWHLKHQYLYEQHFGAVPHGHIIIFIDGNKSNFSPQNLKTITRQESIACYAYPVLSEKRKALSDSIVAGIIRTRTELKREEIPTTLIKMKRAELKIKRELKKIAQNESK